MKTKPGGLAVQWGEVFRIRRKGVDLPVSGASGDFLGVMRSAGTEIDKDGRESVVSGDTFYGIVEFDRFPRARVLLAYGNASQPGSQHNGDQLTLFSENRMREAWTERTQIERNLEDRVDLP